ncbi:MAG: transcription antitermination factor NusB [Desulfovibrio sp.]|nr:transcription antitermination factor NusB [Desulfovibrio sp.]
MIAFQVLYGLSFATVDNLEALKHAFLTYPSREEANLQQFEDFACPEPRGFAWELVYGVWSKGQELDQQIRHYSQNWKLERIGHIERTVLRLAFYELLYCKETPPRVVINEALELSNEFSELAAKKFINGLLDAALKDIDQKEARPNQA